MNRSLDQRFIVSEDFPESVVEKKKLNVQDKKAYCVLIRINIQRPTVRFILAKFEIVR